MKRPSLLRAGFSRKCFSHNSSSLVNLVLQGRASMFQNLLRVTLSWSLMDSNVVATFESKGAFFEELPATIHPKRVF